MISPLSFIPLLPFALPLLPSALALTSDAMRPRSVYQLVTDRFALPSSSSSSSCPSGSQNYCGGTWAGVTSQLAYIQGMGFDTIWISPVVSNIGGSTGEGEAFHGYWTLDPSQLNSNFGTADDLKALSAALHSRGMYLMLDVVVNHVAATSSNTFSPDSSYGPFSASDDYHPFCWITDYTNQTNVEQCWLGDTTVSLPDLNTESSTVIDYWNSWIPQLVANYSADAIRIDTVEHIRHSFWPDFVTAAGVFNQGEVLDGDPTYVGDYQSNGSVNPFNYPVYYPLVRAFNGTQQDITALVAMVGSVKTAFADPTLAGMFLNNADNPRFENYTSDEALRMNAHAYALVGDGIPYVYYGTEAGLTGGDDPYNREALWTSGYNTTSTMYKYFAHLNAARSAAGNASSSFYTSQMNISALTSTELLIAKQPLISVLSNGGSSYSSASNLSIPTSSSGWSASTLILDATTCQTYTTGSDGSLSIGIVSGQPRILLADSIKGSLCSSGVAAANVFDGSSSSGTDSSSSTSSTSSKTGSSSGGEVARGASLVVVGLTLMGVVGFGALM